MTCTIFKFLVGVTASTAVALSLTGCIPNKIYRPYPNDAISVPSAPSLMTSNTTKKIAKSPDQQCERNNLKATPCLAFLEFDEFGEPWERSSHGRPAQLTNVLDLIAKAKREDPNTLILVFVHGWKHNASGTTSDNDDSNITGLKSVLSYLHETVYPGHPVLGVYVAWRGGTISPTWLVSQQFTYFNREAAAIRVGNTSMTDALIEISDAVRTPAIPTEKIAPAKLLFIGHSFGALVLERAISQAMVTRLEREWSDETKLGSSNPSSPTTVTEPLADLVIYVNSAAAATESKQMMDYLAFSHFRYQDPTCVPGEKTDCRDEPLFLSITSQADTATGTIFKIGHGASYVGYWLTGSMRKATGEGSISPANDNANDGRETLRTDQYARACFDPRVHVQNKEPESTIRFDVSQTGYYMSTTAHKAELWSHRVNEFSNPPLKAGESANPLPHCERVTDSTNIYEKCTMSQYSFTVEPIDGRCNGTPYWVLQVPKEIIPDHGTIFTGRLVAFLQPFISSSVGVTRNGAPTEAPTLSRPSAVAR